MTIGGAQATVTYSGLVQAGVYQINVTVPSTTPSGNAEISASIGGQTTQTGVILDVN